MVVDGGWQINATSWHLLLKHGSYLRGHAVIYMPEARVPLTLQRQRGDGFNYTHYTHLAVSTPGRFRRDGEMGLVAM